MNVINFSTDAILVRCHVTIITSSSSSCSFSFQNSILSSFLSSFFLHLIRWRNSMKGKREDKQLKSPQGNPSFLLQLTDVGRFKTLAVATTTMLVKKYKFYIQKLRMYLSLIKKNGEKRRGPDTRAHTNKHTLFLLRMAMILSMMELDSRARYLPEL